MDVTFNLSGTLAARTGTHRVRIGVERGATVADAVERLAGRHGRQVRAGLLEGRRFRTEVVAAREGAAGYEPLSADDPLDADDVVSVWTAESGDPVEHVERVRDPQHVGARAAVEHEFVG